MRYLALLLAVLFLIPSPAEAKEAAEYIAEAQKLQQSGQAAEAVALLHEAAEEHPEDSDVHAYLGLYTGMGAGSATDYMEAGRLMTVSFQLLDRAVELGPENPTAYLLRGIMGIKVPGFLGRLDSGIADLKKAVKLYSAAPPGEAGESLVTSWTMLAEAYAAKGDVAGQREALENIIKLAGGSPAAEAAEKKLAGLPSAEKKPAIDKEIVHPSQEDGSDISSIKKALQNDPGNTELLLNLGRAYYDAGSFRKARTVLKQYVELDETSAEAYKLLSLSIARMAENGYDENIYEDTDYMSGVAFEAMNNMDKAVSLAPNDLELRLTRGIFGIMFPFFLGKYDQGIADLEMVVAGAADEPDRAQALYYLGYGYRRKALQYWIKAAKDYPGTEAAKMVMNDMRPPLAHFDPSQHEAPYVKIDFILGFQDELAPQTAVWIEDEKGGYVKTIYVSGFAGHAKEKQIDLPKWAMSSDFKGVDAVTSASIDVGHYIYVWDMTDYEGKKVEEGAYKVKVETHYWPTMKYQIAEAAIKAAEKDDASLVEEGDYIPRLEVSYRAK